MKPRTYHDSVTVLNAELIDGYGGQQTRDWAHATRTVVSANVQPVSTPQEQLDRRDLTISRWFLYCAPGEPLDAYSRILWDDPDRPMEIDGDPQVHHLRGEPHHIEAFLRRVGDSA